MGESMLKRIFAKVRPSPAMAVALFGVALGLGSTGWAANGAAFVLGVINSATQRTALTANFNGNALEITNTSAGVSATALKLTVAAGHPPMKVNTVTKVTNLNADYLDGFDSTALTRVHNVPYSLAAGAVSAPITVPANRPVQLIGINLTGTTPNDGGVGQAALVRFPGAYIQWVGLHSWVNPSIAQGSSNSPGVDILYIALNHDVVVETAGPDTIHVHNISGQSQSGSVTLMW